MNARACEEKVLLLYIYISPHKPQADDENCTTQANKEARQTDAVI